MSRKINNIAVDFVKMKNNFNNTVKLLQPFFSTLTIIGIISMYFYINILKIGLGEYINVVLFVNSNTRSPFLDGVTDVPGVI